MSEPKRYTDLQVWEALHFAGSTNGWIRWEDYARLKADAQVILKHLDEASADCARLKADVNELAAGLKLASEVGIKIADEVTRLKAENERLRAASFVTAVPVKHYERLLKAGDAVALDYAERIEIEAGETAKTLMKTLPVLREWNAAKEGKPSV